VLFPEAGLEQRARSVRPGFNWFPTRLLPQPGATLKFVTEQILRLPVPPEGFPICLRLSSREHPIGNEALLARLEQTLGAPRLSPANPTGTAP
jgi:hypothetical protein